MRRALRKLWGDVAATPWRYIMMVIAIAVSTAAIVAMLVAYSVLTREVQRNYMDTNPAAAQIMLGQVDVMDNAENILSAMRKNPNITDVEIGGHSYFKMEVAPNEFVTVLVFIASDLKDARINKLRLDKGEWPKTGEVLLERKALSVAHATIGNKIKLIGRNGVEHSLLVNGTVHDPALAPADTEHIVYAYMSHATFLSLQESPSENFIKFTVAPAQLNISTLEAITAESVKNISPFFAVHEIRIPPPARHPHQTQMTAGLRMLLIFSVLAMVLGSVLIATTFWGLLAQQIRQIGIMKAIGASSAQIFSLYLILVIIIGSLALLVGFPLGIWAGRELIFITADLLNLNIADIGLPLSLWLFSIFFCLGLPVLMALYPIHIAATKTVRAALDDYGVTHVFSNADNFLSKLKFFSPVQSMVLRNMLRRSGRLSFTLLLLAMAGATFISSQNLLASWDFLGQQAQAYRHYQIEAGFAEDIPQDVVQGILSQHKSIQSVEFFNRYSATPITKNGLAIERVYPDGGHGSLKLYALPVQTKMISLELYSGHWLSEQNADEVVINQTAYSAFFADKKIGDTIDVQVHDKNNRFRLVGILAEPLAGAALYVNKISYTNPNAFRLTLDDRSSSNIDALSIQLQQEFKQSGISLNSITTENQRKRSGNGHLMIMVVILVMIAVAMIVVGFLSLATVMSTNVSERLREFAVMRTIGAKNATIFYLIIGESILIALCSFLAALPITILFSVFMVRVLASISMQPLSLVVSANGLLSWLAIAAVGAVLSALIPALNAMRFSIREVLSYS